RLDPGGTQSIDQLAEAAAYEHWHRLLFTRFLADNHLLHTGGEHGSVPVTLKECDELAPELGARDGFDLACRFASETLPGIFRRDDPVLDLRLAPNHEVQLRRLLDELPAETFRTDDALGWTYQFWQAKRKDEVNKSGVKIGARELPAVTQLFTEDYMVEFLLHNSLGAWWAGK
ncbi:SAM-dependent DNA methyltransferase, partial [bacterium]|nr:SAM-dependent DNA methyltransferase [bacterium]